MEEHNLHLEGLPEDLDNGIPQQQCYFKNKRKSGGELGEIQEQPENKRQALLIYPKETETPDFKNVYNQGTHKIDFKAQGDVDLTVELLNNRQMKSHELETTTGVQLYKETRVAEQWDPRRFILSGFQDSCKCQMISIFIGSCSQNTAHTWEVVDDERIVVTFIEDIDSKSFIEKCAAQKHLGINIDASHLEFTNSVLVQGDMRKVSEELLTLYFSNNECGGGVIKSLIWVNEKKSVVISFQDGHVAQEVVARKHHLCGADLTTLLFYSSLKKALTGQMPTWSNIPVNMIITVHKLLCSFLEKNKKCKYDFESQLKAVHANVAVDKTTSPGEIALEMAVDKDSLAALRLRATWESKVQKHAQTFWRRYSTAELPADYEIWKRLERDCLRFNCTDAEVSFLEPKSKIIIVGLKTQVTVLSHKIQNLIKNVNAEIEVERNSIEKVIQFDSKQKYELVEKWVHGKIQNVTLTKDEISLRFHLRGLRKGVHAAKKVIKQAKENVIFQQLKLPDHLLQFLKSSDLQLFEQNHFVTSNIPALFLIDGEILGIIAEKEYITAAEEKVNEVLKQEVVELSSDPNRVIINENWVNFLNKIKGELKDNSQNVSMIHSQTQIVICGFAQVVVNLSKRIKDYVDDNTSTTELIRLKSSQEVEFVDSCMNLSAIPEIQNLGMSIQFYSTCLKVIAPKQNIQHVVTAVKRHISSILTEKQTYSAAGESKVILKHKTNIQAKVKEWGCMAHIPTHKSGPPKTCSYQINSYITLTFAVGDLQHFPADALICPISINLDFRNPIAQRFLQVAGSDIQEVCNIIHKKKQPLLAGEVIVSTPGNLKANNLIYTVLPQSGQRFGHHYLKSAIFNSLQTAESNRKDTSVAMPAIGCDTFGFSTQESCRAIIDAVQNFANDQQNSLKNIKNIFVVDSDVKILEEFNIIITQMGFSKSQKDKQTSNSEGVSGAIFRAAGASVQQECQNHGPLQGNAVAVTSAGNLEADFIVHMIGPKSPAEAKTRVKKVLERCEEKQISRISFPALGTGAGGVKSIDSITAMLQGFRQHLCRHFSTALKYVYVVIDRDEVLKEFQQGLIQWAANSQDTDDTEEYQNEDDACSYGSYEESWTSEEEDENFREVTIGLIKVKLLHGDITKEMTDAIVNSTDTSLNLSTGVSGAILKSAGQTVVDDCKMLGVQPIDGVVLTTAGKLPVNHIIHMVGQITEKEITRSMYNVLKKCEENKIQSVSFPALGTGAGNLAAAPVADAMMDALVEFSVDLPVFLKTVHIVIFQATMLSDFEDAMKKFKMTAHKPPSAAVRFPVTNVEVYATSSTDIAKVKKFMDDLISEECGSREFTSSHLANLPEADKKAIVELSQSKQVHVLRVSNDKFIVSGRIVDVLEAILQITNFSEAAQDRKNREDEERRIAKMVRWEVAEGEAWFPLSINISYDLELAFHKQEQTFYYQDKGQTFKVDFKEMKRVDTKYGQICKVKRTLFADSDTAIIQPPPTWTNMDGCDLQTVALSPNTEEYKKIHDDFLHSSQHKGKAPFKVVKICRIQSQSQWQRYCVWKQTVDKKYPKQKNEQFLYHGTTKDICEKINSNGFNRSFCGKNAVTHGDGTYFAKEAWYSCYETYSNTDESGLKYIYRARVVTGSPCKSRKGMKEPDPLDPRDPRAGLHDCAVDNLQNPLIFVVFCDAGAYPDYLITFTNV